MPIESTLAASSPIPQHSDPRQPRSGSPSPYRHSSGGGSGAPVDFSSTPVVGGYQHQPSPNRQYHSGVHGAGGQMASPSGMATPQSMRNISNISHISNFSRA